MQLHDAIRVCRTLRVKVPRVFPYYVQSTNKKGKTANSNCDALYRQLDRLPYKLLEGSFAIGLQLGLMGPLQKLETRK